MIDEKSWRAGYGEAIRRMYAGERLDEQAAWDSVDKTSASERTCGTCGHWSRREPSPGCLIQGRCSVLDRITFGTEYQCRDHWTAREAEEVK